MSAIGDLLVDQRPTLPAPSPDPSLVPDPSVRAIGVEVLVVGLGARAIAVRTQRAAGESPERDTPTAARGRILR